jgi:putative oxidoreductase
MVSGKLLMFGPLPIRILAGITFMAHGLPKFEDIAGTQGFFGSIGLPPELALPIGLLEVIGGIFLILWSQYLCRVVQITFAVPNHTKMAVSCA